MLIILSLLLAQAEPASQEQEQEQQQQPPPEDVRPVEFDWTEQVARSYTGLRLNFSPGVFLSNGGVGYSIAASVGYGFRAGPVVVVPVVTPEVYLSSPLNTVINLLAKCQLVYPLGRFAPFVVAGLGPGFITRPFYAGLAVYGAAGLTVQTSPDFAIGLQGSYEAIVGTAFAGWGIAPVIMF